MVRSKPGGSAPITAGRAGRKLRAVVDVALRVGEALLVMGTPAFMAPEQARGERVDARADIYAVGAIAYCCVTGRGPYDLNDAAAALHAVLMSEPPRPRSVAPDLQIGRAHV